VLDCAAHTFGFAIAAVGGINRVCLFRSMDGLDDLVDRHDND